MTLKRKMEEEQGRSAPKLVLPAGMKPPKPGAADPRAGLAI